MPSIFQKIASNVEKKIVWNARTIAAIRSIQSDETCLTKLITYRAFNPSMEISRYVRDRIGVPRDMSRGAAAAMRGSIDCVLKAAGHDCTIKSPGSGRTRAASAYRAAA